MEKYCEKLFAIAFGDWRMTQVQGIGGMHLLNWFLGGHLKVNYLGHKDYVLKKSNIFERLRICHIFSIFFYFQVLFPLLFL